MTTPRILVAGIGNVLLGDDGFGVEVARRLAARDQPAGVRVVEYGVRGLDLAYALLDGYEAAILVDAAHRSGPAGSLYVIAPEPGAADASPDPHELTPERVLALVRALGGDVPSLWLVGCEPQRLGDDDGDPFMGLSPVVAAAVEPAMALVDALVDRVRRGEVARA
jgi:hydrogenase maturation protease